MKLMEQLNQLDRLDALIRRKATGRPKDLAERLAVSERTIYNLLEILRLLGAEIDFCRARGSYYYQNEIKFRFDLVVRGSEEKKMRGGKKKNGKPKMSCCNRPPAAWSWPARKSSN